MTRRDNPRSQRLLYSIHACTDARHWVNGKSLREAWEGCRQPEWLNFAAAALVGKPGFPTVRQALKAYASLLLLMPPPTRVANSSQNRRWRDAMAATRAYLASDEADAEKTYSGALIAAFDMDGVGFDWNHHYALRNVMHGVLGAGDRRPRSWTSALDTLDYALLALEERGRDEARSRMKLIRALRAALPVDWAAVDAYAANL